MDCSMPGFPVLHQLPEPTQTPLSQWWVISIESVMPSNHLIVCPPLLLTPLIFPSIIVVSSESHSIVSDSCDPMDYSLPGSSVHGILQARILEWVAISFSRGSSLPKNQTQVSCIAGRFFTDWAMREAPSIMVFSNESVLHIRWPKYWSSASASVLPMNTQDWSPLGWTGWISLLSKGLSRVFSNTTVQKYQFFNAQLSLQPNSHIHTWLLEKSKLWLDGPLLAASGILLKFEFYHMAPLTSLSLSDTPALSESNSDSDKVLQGSSWPSPMASLLHPLPIPSPPLTHSAPATLVWAAGQTHQAHFWQPLLKASLLQSVSLTP